ncbi:hypothetical protein HBI51_252790 [Parastagonospora nodorum]|nr:hypothetical protein HBI51_252790 [Parastagonospora nodorum]
MLSDLPTEIKLQIIQRIQHLWSVAYTNKEHFELVVEILLQRAKTSESFSEARRAIHNLEKWHVHHAKLANRFYSQAQTEVSRNIGIDNIDAAMKILGVIQQLPLSTKIPDNCFSDVFTAVHKSITQPKRLIQYIHMLLTVTQRLPPNTKIPDCFLIFVTSIWNKINHNIRAGDIRAINALLRIVQQLPKTKIPDNCFSDVITTIRDCINQNIRNGNIGGTNMLLEVIQQLPKTTIPDNYFSDVITTIRDCINQNIRNGNIGGTNMLLEVIQQLPKTTIPDNYFSDVVTTVRDPTA